MMITVGHRWERLRTPKKELKKEKEGKNIAKEGKRRKCQKSPNSATNTARIVFKPFLIVSSSQNTSVYQILESCVNKYASFKIFLENCSPARMRDSKISFGGQTTTPAIGLLVQTS